MGITEPARAENADRRLAVARKVWLWMCIFYPLVELSSIAAANILLVFIVVGCLAFREDLALAKARTLFILVGVYLAWTLFAMLISPYPGHVNFWLEKRSVFLAIIPGLIVGVDIRRLGTAYRYVSALLMVEAVYAVYQYFWGWDIVRMRSLTGLYDHYLATGLQNFHLTFAGMIALALPTSLGFASRKFLKSWLLALAGALCIVASMARAMMLGLIGGGALLLVLGSRRLRLAGIILILAMIILSGTIFNASGQRMLFGLGMAHTTAPQGDPSRIYIWKSALNIIQHFPVSGVGVCGWDPAFQQYKAPFEAYSSTAHAHNDFLASAVEGGLIGAALFFLLWGYIILKGALAVCRSRGEARDLRLGFLVALLVLLFGGIFQCYQGDAEDALLLWFTVGVGIQLSVTNNRLTTEEQA